MMRIGFQIDTFGDTRMQNRTLRKLFVLCALMVTLVTSALKPSYALFDKTRFAADLGVAYFCFHHWVYAPYKAGAFASGAPHRTKAIIKGGAALLFALNRVKAANRIAHKSSDPLLQRLAGSVDKMTDSFSSIGQRLKSGSFNPGDIDLLNGAVNHVDAGANAAGIKIKDVPVAIPGM